MNLMKQCASRRNESLVKGGLISPKKYIVDHDQALNHYIDKNHITM